MIANPADVSADVSVVGCYSFATAVCVVGHPRGYSCGQIRVVYIIMGVRARLLRIHTVGRESGCPSLLLRSHYPELKGSLVGACGGAAGISKLIAAGAKGSQNILYWARRFRCLAARGAGAVARRRRKVSR